MLYIKDVCATSPVCIYFFLIQKIKYFDGNNCNISQIVFYLQFLKISIFLILNLFET